MATVLKEIINTFVSGAGSHIIRFHLPRELEQLISAEEALRLGYIPFSSPNCWSIGESRFTLIGYDKRKHTVRGYSADLRLDNLDIPDKTLAYVPSVKMWEDDSVNRHFIISAQFYKKD